MRLQSFAQTLRTRIASHNAELASLTDTGSHQYQLASNQLSDAAMRLAEVERALGLHGAAHSWRSAVATVMHEALGSAARAGEL